FRSTSSGRSPEAHRGTVPTGASRRRTARPIAGTRPVAATADRRRLVFVTPPWPNGRVTTEPQLISATTLEEELGRLAQALLDVEACDGASVALLHCPSASRERSATRSL